MDRAPIETPCYQLPSRCFAECTHPHCARVKQVELWVCPLCEESIGRAWYFLRRGILCHRQCPRV